MLSQGSLFIILVVEPHHVICLPAPRPQQADDGGDEEECGDQGGEAAEGECGASHGRVETADLANTNDTHGSGLVIVSSVQTVLNQNK